MKFAAYLMVASLLALAGAVTFAIIRGEDTRAELRVVKRQVTVDPCSRPRSKSCRRRIRLILRELAGRHPKTLRELGVEPRTNVSETSVPGVSETSGGGGGAGTSPSGGGPIGRVPSPGSPPGPDDPAPSDPPPPEPSPLIDLDAPLPTQVCVDDVLGVNC